MRKLIFIVTMLILTLSSANDIENERVVYRQLLYLISKLDSDPIMWQDTRKGYLTNKAAYISNIALDSLKVSTEYQVIKKYYSELDSLVLKIKDGKEFYGLLDLPKKNYQVNYFYSSSKP